MIENIYNVILFKLDVFLVTLDEPVSSFCNYYDIYFFLQL